jgi:hypothetical protein
MEPPQLYRRPLTRLLSAWIGDAGPDMSVANQDRYFAETAQIAQALGADLASRTRMSALALISTMRPGLICAARPREAARLVLTQRPANRMP